MIGRSLWLAVVAVALAGLGSASAAEIVNVATPSRTIFVLPVWLAEHKGFFREEGLEVKLDVINSGEQIKNQLRSGTTHVSLDSPEGVLIDVQKGGTLRIVAGNARKSPLFIIAKPEIKTIAQLRGATIGVLSLQEGSSKLIPKIAASAGLAPADYRIVAVGGAPTRSKLLQEGKIDAGLQPFPLSYEAEAAGFNNLGWTGTFEPEWQFTTFATNDEWARRNAATLTAFLRAVLRGQQYVLSNPDEAARIGAEELHTSFAFAARAIADSSRLGILDPRLDWSEAGLARIYANLQADGIMPRDQPFDAARFVDATYLRNAQASVLNTAK